MRKLISILVLLCSITAIYSDNICYYQGYKVQYGSGYYTASGEYVANGTIVSGGCSKYITPPSDVPKSNTRPLHIIIKAIGENAFEYCQAVDTIIIPKNCVTIGHHAFYDCEYATSLWLSGDVAYIRQKAFDCCFSLSQITCEANNPPSLGDDVFRSTDKNIPVYVPGWSLSLYKTAAQWKDFYNFQPLVYRGNSGDSIQWAFNTLDSTICVSGHGQIPAEYTYTNTPWFKWRTIIGHIELSEGITAILTEAFFNYSFVRSITSHAVEPPLLGARPFNDIDRSIPVYVPSNSVEAYQNALGWNEFTNILPISNVHTPVNEISQDQHQNQKFIKDGQVFILRGSKIYTVTAQEVR